MCRSVPILRLKGSFYAMTDKPQHVSLTMFGIKNCEQFLL
ncbi:Uncharacterised protein [Serratia fonticola]|nr:Uncharacterised protein [Serratia fonticola]